MLNAAAAPDPKRGETSLLTWRAGDCFAFRRLGDHERSCVAGRERGGRGRWSPMVTRVVRVRARAAIGDTVMVGGRAAVVVHLLPREGRTAARGAGDP